MSQDNDRIIDDHEYDGIHEYDNPLPAWWLMVFFGTIIFAFIYWMHYTVGGGPTLVDELKVDSAAMQAKFPGGQEPTETDEIWSRLSGDPKVLTQGKSVFAAKCAACHGNELQGLIGPNLVDDYWIHGRGAPSEIATVVRKGVLDKGMPTWEGQLSNDDIRSVVVFVVSQRGTKPANPKPPQGEKVDR